MKEDEIKSRLDYDQISNEISSRGPLFIRGNTIFESNKVQFSPNAFASEY